MNIIDKIARKLCTNDGLVWNDLFGAFTDRNPKEIRDLYRELACEIIELIREPTQDMRLQGLKALVIILEKEAETLKDSQDKIPSGTPIMPIMFLPMRSSLETDAVYHAYLDVILGKKE